MNKEKNKVTINDVELMLFKIGIEIEPTVKDREEPKSKTEKLTLKRDCLPGKDGGTENNQGVLPNL